MDTDWRPRVVVEVDGSSHGSMRRRRRDALVDAALGAAGIAAVRLKHGSSWEPPFRERLGA